MGSSSERPAYAHNVRGNLFKERYDWLGDPVDLDAPIEAYHRALILTDPDGADRDGFSGNLAMAYADRFLLTGHDADLASAQQLTGAA